MIKKINVNFYTGKISDMNTCKMEFIKIFNQKPYLIKSKNPSSSFKVRPGITGGLKCTIRAKEIDNFLKGLRWLILPNIRNFKGFSTSCINGNSVNLGIRDIDNAPHLINENLQYIKGFNLVFVLNTDLKKNIKDFFLNLKIPFRN